MKTSSDQNAEFLKAYPDSKVDLWDQNIVNGEYIIAYEMNLGLDPKLKNMLPKVRSRLSLRLGIVYIGYILYKSRVIARGT